MGSISKCHQYNQSQTFQASLIARHLWGIGKLKLCKPDFMALTGNFPSSPDLMHTRLYTDCNYSKAAGTSGSRKGYLTMQWRPYFFSIKKNLTETGDMDGMLYSCSRACCTYSILFVQWVSVDKYNCVEAWYPAGGQWHSHKSGVGAGKLLHLGSHFMQTSLFVPEEEALSSEGVSEVSWM